MAVWWGSVSSREEAAAGEDNGEQPLSDKPPLIQCGETCSTWQ